MQFTATPFRNDGKKSMAISFTISSRSAQERGFFKPINFYPIYEFDNDKKDIS
jgi:hypothetical protein